jgi:hypothetical protein
VQQHGRSGKVLRRPPEEWQGISVGVGVDVCTFIGVSVVVARRTACRRRRCAVVQLIGSRTALAPVAVPFAGLPLHRNILRRASIAGLGIHAKLLV